MDLTSALAFVGTPLAMGLPLMVLWIVGLVLSAFHVRDRPQLAALAATGFGILLMTPFIWSGFFLAVMVQSDQLGYDAMGRMLAVAALARSVARAFAIALLLGAAASAREPAETE
jgi:hypothetical protein